MSLVKASVQHSNSSAVLLSVELIDFLSNPQVYNCLSQNCQRTNSVQHMVDCTKIPLYTSQKLTLTSFFRHVYL